MVRYHFLTLTQPWKCGWLLSTYFQINGHLPETQKQRCPCCHAWAPLLFDLLFSFCMEISWLLNQPKGLDSSVRLKVQLAFCCLGRNSKSHLTKGTKLPESRTVIRKLSFAPRSRAALSLTIAAQFLRCRRRSSLVTAVRFLNG